jgi:hypothetical protein
LYGRAKALFDLVAPQEYGFDQEAKEEIGVLTSLPLLRKVWNDLTEAKTTGKSLACFYFTYVKRPLKPRSRRVLSLQQRVPYHHLRSPAPCIGLAIHQCAHT